MVFEPKLKDAFTCTGALASAKPYDEAVMIAEPKLTPVTCGTAVGVVAPPRKMMFAGFTDTVVGSLLTKETYTTRVAGCANVTGSDADWPGPIETPGVMLMS